jgi:hypothetical protein
VSGPHPPGYLSWGAIVLNYEKECRFCHEKFVGPGNAQTCKACFGTPEHTKWIKRHRKRYARRHDRKVAKA